METAPLYGTFYGMPEPTATTPTSRPGEDAIAPPECDVQRSCPEDQQGARWPARSVCRRDSLSLVRVTQNTEYGPLGAMVEGRQIAGAVPGDGTLETVVLCALEPALCV